MKPSARFIWKRTKLWSQGTSKSPDCKQTLRILHPHVRGYSFQLHFFGNSFMQNFCTFTIILKMRLGGEICSFDVNVNKGYSTKH